MKSNDSVSVIIPVYNTGNYIIKLLESLLNQTYKNVEYLLIDDGSTDDSAELIKEFISTKNIKKYFKYFYKENGGPSSARNYGISVSKGQYIMFIDSDDLVENSLIEKLLKSLVQNNSDVSICNANIIKKNILINSEISENVSKEAYITSIFSSTLARKKYEFNFSFSRTVWGKLYKSNIIKNNSIWFDEKMFLFEDGYFNLKYFSLVNNISIITESLYKYYIENGISGQYRENLFNENNYKIKEINKLNFSNSNMYIAKNLYFFDLLCVYIKNYINNKKNKNNILNKVKLVKLIFKYDLYIEIFNSNCFKYLNCKKKIIYILIKLRLYFWVTIILK